MMNENARKGTEGCEWHNIALVRAKLIDILDKVLDHGFGEIRLETKSLKNEQRELVITAGKKYRFVLRPKRAEKAI